MYIAKAKTFNVLEINENLSFFQEVNNRVTERSPMLGSDHYHRRGNDDAVGFLGALKIPGVVEFSLCLFFSKLVSYTFLYWLPLYIQSSTTLGATLSADLSVSVKFIT